MPPQPTSIDHEARELARTALAKIDQHQAVCEEIGINNKAALAEVKTMLYRVLERLSPDGDDSPIKALHERIDRVQARIWNGVVWAIGLLVSTICALGGLTFWLLGKMLHLI